MDDRMTNAMQYYMDMSNAFLELIEGLKKLDLSVVINQVCDTKINKRDSQGFLADHNLDSRV